METEDLQKMEMNLPKAPTYNDLRKLTDYLVEKTSKKELEMLMLEAYTKKVDNTITKITNPKILQFVRK